MHSSQHTCTIISISFIWLFITAHKQFQSTCGFVLQLTLRTAYIKNDCKVINVLGIPFFIGDFFRAKINSWALLSTDFYRVKRISTLSRFYLVSFLCPRRKKINCTNMNVRCVYKNILKYLMPMFHLLC